MCDLLRRCFSTSFCFKCRSFLMQLLQKEKQSESNKQDQKHDPFYHNLSVIISTRPSFCQHGSRRGPLQSHSLACPWCGRYHTTCRTEFGEMLLMQYSTIQEQGTRRRSL